MKIMITGGAAFVGSGVIKLMTRSSYVGAEQVMSSIL